MINKISAKDDLSDRLTMSIIMVGWFDHISQIYQLVSVVVLLLGIELVNIAASRCCKMLLLILLLQLLLSAVIRVASIERWVLSVGLGIVAKLGWVVPLLVRISIAPVFLLLDMPALLMGWVVALLVLVGRVVVWLGGGWVVLQQVGGLCSPKLLQFIPIHLDR